MSALHLIQHCNGVELPAAGEWVVHRGQPLTVSTSTRLRSRHVVLHTDGGRLVTAERPDGVTLELAASGTDRGQARTFTYRGWLTSADRLGLWRFTGVGTLDDDVVDLSFELHYHGVYAQGAAPVAWIGFAATGAWPSARSQARHRRRRLMVDGGLNIQAPDHLRPSPDPSPPFSTGQRDLPGRGV